ncbi:manganese transporter [Pseudoclavibacter endophyticus]|uniref:Zinc ABC transporter substrate-binding protein n=1 Tax=Pseudoclavibacter endophyticus TaxID=1778590 RepID=A0A6H9WQM2_9MICO|nr:zinc ABC transporter substrate-binding protein [Pseudoclavibacter endophyticus]KAB1649267.1 zinc ABC transporter substrate-binding protein [Pseudoclavibacter endophyticus]GGA63987.1 manganese transporter [Pseudoclavibacter endophyticus]
MTRLGPAIACLVALAVALAGCSHANPAGAGAADGADAAPGTAAADTGGAGAGLDVYATTGYLADAIANIAPGATVTTMVGPGGDPHTHQPSTRDIEAILDADVVFWNGLHLEAQMVDQLTSLGDRQLAVGDRLPDGVLLDWPDTDADGNALHDPHVWNSPTAWSLVVGLIADKLSALDPSDAATYAANADAYVAEIASAAENAERMLATVPEPRILITGHDAFNYFGATYDLDVYATDFVSSDAALSPQELSGLAGLIAEHQVPVIFMDNQANPQAITSLQEAVQARGWQVAVADAELYADSLGAEPGVDTYLGVLAHNAAAIADALGEEPA